MPYYMHELNPDYNPALGMIQHMTTDELKQLLNDDDRVESMIKGLQQVKRNESEREMLLNSNKSLATYNLSQEAVITSLRSKLIEDYNKVVSVKGSLESKKHKLDGLKRQMSLDTTLALLQAASAETEEESETVSENFLSGDITVDSFLEQYLKKRKAAHLRRIKAEKMVELLNQQQSRASHSFSGALPVTNAQCPTQPNSFAYPYGPYPVSSQNMPMPMPYYR